MSEATVGDRKDASVFNRLSATTRRTLDAFLKSGLADKVIAEAESRTLDARRVLLIELAAVEKAAKKSQPQLEADCVAIAAELAAAELALSKLRDKHRLAAALAEGPTYAAAGERLRITNELRASADPRLADFAFYLDEIRSNELVAALQVWPDVQKRDKGIEPAISGNLTQVVTAKGAVSAAIERVEAARLQAITSMEVSELLVDVCEKVAPALAALLFNPPSLSADELEPGPPLRYGSASEWIVPSQRSWDRAERSRRSQEIKSLADSGAKGS